MSILSKLIKPKIKSEDLSLTSNSKAQSYQYDLLDRDIDKVLATKGYSFYTDEMMADDQIKSCILIKKLGVTVGGYEVQPAVGESDSRYTEAKNRADFISYVLINMKGSLLNVLYNIANAIVTGFSVNEILWDYIVDTESDFNGLLGISEIKSKPVNDMYFDMDEYGNINQIIQRIMGVENRVKMDKVLFFSYDPTSKGLPQGVSDLRAAYRHYWSKDALMRYRNVAAEKFAAPTVVGKYPQYFTKEQKKALLSACKSFALDTAIIIPEGAEIELKEAKGSVVMPYDASIEVSDKGISKAIFGQILANNEGGSGSYAQAKVHLGILGMFLTGLRNDIAEHVLYEQLIKRLIDYNYPDKGLYPKVVLTKPSDDDLMSYASVIEKLVGIGVVDKNEPFIRERMGMPPKPLEIIQREQEASDKLQENLNNAGDNSISNSDNNSNDTIDTNKEGVDENGDSSTGKSYKKTS